jgi:hypothetical protein
MTAVERKTGGGRMPRNTRPDQIGTGGRITPEYAVRRYAPMIKGEVRGFSVELGRIRKGREFRAEISGHRSCREDARSLPRLGWVWCPESPYPRLESH